MPLYEYKCLRCKKVFEVLQRINSEPQKHCIYCQGEVKKLVSLSTFQFKGSGWYITDYKEQPAKPATENKKNRSAKKKDNKNVST